MNHQMLCHVWAQRTKKEGTASRIFFDGDTIYSYGRHFPIATFIDTKDGVKVVFNDDRYSVSTGKHKSYVQRAIPSDMPLVYADTETLKFISQYKEQLLAKGKNHTKESFVAQVHNIIDRVIVRQAIAAGNRRTKTKKAAEIETAVTSYNGYGTLLAAFNLKMPATLAKRLEKLQTDYAAVIADADKHKKALDKKRAKEAEERGRLRQIRARAAGVLWKAHKSFDDGDETYTYGDLREHQPVIMRLNGDNIETSMGAEFPIEHGRKAFDTILRCHETGAGWKRNGHAIHLGHFQIDEIHPDGSVKAGCHTVPYSEIEAIAKQIGLI